MVEGMKNLEDATLKNTEALVIMANRKNLDLGSANSGEINA